MFNPGTFLDSSGMRKYFICICFFLCFLFFFLARPMSSMTSNTSPRIRLFSMELEASKIGQVIFRNAFGVERNRLTDSHADGGRRSPGLAPSLLFDGIQHLFGRPIAGVVALRFHDGVAVLQHRKPVGSGRRLPHTRRLGSSLL